MGAILAGLFMSPNKTPIYKTEFGTPLPKEMHIEIGEDEVGDKKVIVIGDVHGCLDELKQLLAKAEVNSNNSVIIFCGDVINKGPKNLETLQYIRGLNAYVVRGNHEECVINQWLKLQQMSTDPSKLKSKHTWIQDLTLEEAEYLQQLPYTVSIPFLNIIVVHGGLFPGKPLNLQQPINMTKMRNILDWDTFDPKISSDIYEGVPWASLWSGPMHVYFGHDARRGLQLHPYATGLDTGCLYGKELSAVIIHPEKSFISINAERPYKDPRSKSGKGSMNGSVLNRESSSSSLSSSS